MPWSLNNLLSSSVAYFQTSVSAEETRLARSNTGSANVQNIIVHPSAINTSRMTNEAFLRLRNPQENDRLADIQIDIPADTHNPVTTSLDVYSKLTKSFQLAWQQVEPKDWYGVFIDIQFPAILMATASGLFVGSLYGIAADEPTSVLQRIQIGVMITALTYGFTHFVGEGKEVAHTLLELSERTYKNFQSHQSLEDFKNSQLLIETASREGIRVSTLSMAAEERQLMLEVIHSRALFALPEVAALGIHLREDDYGAQAIRLKQLVNRPLPWRFPQRHMVLDSDTECPITLEAIQAPSNASNSSGTNRFNNNQTNEHLMIERNFQPENIAIYKKTALLKQWVLNGKDINRENFTLNHLREPIFIDPNCH